MLDRARRRRGVLRASSSLVAVTLVATLAAGCGTKRSAELAAAASARQEAAARVGPDDGPGVTATSVSVGFIVLDTAKLESTLGFTLPKTGDLDAQIAALADEVNRTGGVGGRKMVPVIRHFEALTDSQASEGRLCKAFTEDDRVFAVVLVGQLQSTVRSCYQRARTLMLDTTAFPLDQRSFESYAPYLWQPSYPEYGEVTAAMVSDLGRSGFFRGATVGVIGIDNPQNRRVYDNEIASAMNEIGVRPADVRWIDASSSASLQAGQDQAVLSFKGAGVERLLVVGGSRLAAFMMATAQKQSWFPAFALSTFDTPDFGIRNYPESMRGAAGVSLLPGYDVDDDQYAFPAPGAEQRCVTALGRRGATFERRANARQQLLYCDAAFLLRDAFAGVSGAVNAQAFANGVRRLGGRFESAAAYVGGFASDGFTGSAGYRRTRFEPSCRCMVLDGPTRMFGGR